MSGPDLRDPLLHGFVATLRPDATCFEAPVHRDVCDDSDLRRVRTAGLQVAARPFVTTPEAVGEEQPFVTPTLILAYAGHLDNRAELTALLCRPDLQTATDGALLVAVYDAWGTAGFRRIVGEFAAVYFDRGRAELIAVRDSLGVGRVYWHEEQGQVHVASSLALLLDTLTERPALDPKFFAPYFASGGLLHFERTIYQGVRELPPAHYLRIAQSGMQIERYWQPDPAASLSFRDDRECDEAFRAILSAGVLAATRSNGPVWSDLSGGLDSSTVTVVAASLASETNRASSQLSAFSFIASQSPVGDEQEYQAEVLDAWKMPHHRLDEDEYPSFADAAAMPVHPSKTMLYGGLWRAAADLFDTHRVRVHLTGRGGDPLFCGDQFPPLFLSDYLQRGQRATWAREAWRWAKSGRYSLVDLYRNCSRGASTDPSGRVTSDPPPTWIRPPLRSAILQALRTPWAEGPRLFESPARELQFRHVLRTAAIARFHPVGDERHPLLFRPLVEFALALPWKHLVRPRIDRVVQRRAMVGYLPELVRMRRSKSSSTTLILRGLREHWDRLGAVVRGEHLADLGLVESDGFYAACLRLRHGVFGQDLRYLLAALSLELWLAGQSATSHSAAQSSTSRLGSAN